jgi:hypothetical protein
VYGDVKTEDGLLTFFAANTTSVDDDNYGILTSQDENIEAINITNNKKS